MELEHKGAKSKEAFLMASFASYYYKNLYGLSSNNREEALKLVTNLKCFNNYDTNLIDEDISKIKVIKAIKASKSGKAPGEDGLVIELYKEFSNLLGGILS